MRFLNLPFPVSAEPRDTIAVLWSKKDGTRHLSTLQYTQGGEWREAEYRLNFPYQYTANILGWMWLNRS